MNAYTDPSSIIPPANHLKQEYPGSGVIASPEGLSQHGIVAGVLAFDTAAITLSGLLASRLWVPEFGKTWLAAGFGLALVLAVALVGMGRC